MSKPRLLWVGDAVQQTGFARVTHNVLAHLTDRWDVHVLGINYLGDPHPYPYAIYPAMLGGDVWGAQRFGDLVRRIEPHMVCLLQDPWIVPKYLNTDAPPDVPIVAYMPVDGKNLAMAPAVNPLDCAIWYTKFGENEAVRAGYTGKNAIIPHGVDPTVYFPGDMHEARAKMGLDKVLPKNAFIVGNINRNQPRKRIDLTIEGFARWWHMMGKPADAFLYLHCSRYDIGYDVVQLARYYGIAKHMIMSKVKLKPGDAISETALRIMYQCLSAHMSTTLGEGWGLTTHEAMACGIATAVPEWSALAEWPRGSVYYMRCSQTSVTPKGINTIGGVVDPGDITKFLTKAYKDVAFRQDYAKRAVECATRDEFMWPNIANQFHDVFTASMKQEFTYANAGPKQAADDGLNEVSPAPAATT